MEHKGLLLLPVVFAVGAYLGHRYGDQVERACCKPAATTKTDEAVQLANQPVYLRETRTNGEGL